MKKSESWKGAERDVEEREIMLCESEKWTE